MIIKIDTTDSKCSTVNKGIHTTVKVKIKTALNHQCL